MNANDRALLRELLSELDRGWEIIKEVEQWMIDKLEEIHRSHLDDGVKELMSTHVVYLAYAGAVETFGEPGSQKSLIEFRQMVERMKSAYRKGGF